MLCGDVMVCAHFCRIHIEKTKIRYAMIRKIKETKNSLLAKTKDQLHTTTKRVIMENEQMTTGR